MAQLYPTINVALTLEIRLTCTTFIIDDKGGTRDGHWYSIVMDGRDLHLGSEGENYPTREKAEKAARRAVRDWAKRQRAWAKKRNEI